MTLRPEPFVALLLTFAIAAVVRFSQRPGPGPLLALAALAALGITTHLTGSVIALSAFTVVPGAVEWCRAQDRLARTASLVVIGLSGLTLGFLLLGLDSDASLVRSGVATNTASTLYRFGIVDQAINQFENLSFVAGLQRIWPVLAILFAITFLSVGSGIRSRAARWAGYSALAGYAGLVLTGSALAQHFGAIVPGAAVLGALAINRLLEMGRAGSVWLVGLAVAVSASLAWAMRSTMGWIVGDLSEHAWAELPHLGAWLWGALAAIGAALGGVVATRRRGPGSRTRGAVMGAAVPLLCAPLALTWGLTLIDAAETPNWSYTRQTLKEITGRKGCGVGDFVGVVTDAKPLTEMRVDRGRLPLASPDAYSPFLLSATVKPFGAPVWGTFGTTQGDEHGGTGPVATPWFDVRDTPEVAFWSLGHAGRPNDIRPEVVVERGGGRQKIVRLAGEPPLDTPWWAFHRVQHLPSGASALRLVMAPGGTREGDWLATTAPVAPVYTSFTDATAHEAVWRNPDQVFAMPCRLLPSPTGGVIQPFRWSLGPPGSDGQAIASEHPIIERGCLHPRRSGTTRFCAVELLPTR